MNIQEADTLENSNKINSQSSVHNVKKSFPYLPPRIDDNQFQADIPEMLASVENPQDGNYFDLKFLKCNSFLLISK